MSSLVNAFIGEFSHLAQSAQDLSTPILLDDRAKTSLSQINQVVFVGHGILKIGKLTLGVVSITFLTTGLVAIMTSTLLAASCLASGIALVILHHDINQLQSGCQYLLETIHYVDTNLSISRSDILRITDETASKINHMKDALILLSSPLRESLSLAEDSIRSVHGLIERA